MRTGRGEEAEGDGWLRGREGVGLGGGEGASPIVGGEAGEIANTTRAVVKWGREGAGLRGNKEAWGEARLCTPRPRHLEPECC